MIRIYRWGFVAGAVLTFGAGCQSESERKREQVAFAEDVAREQERLREEAEERKAEEEKLRIRRERDAILKNPGIVLEPDGFEYFDKGIINDYRQLSKMSVMNKSKYALTDIAGEVDWLDSEGQKVGSVPFTLTGSIPAGDTKWFSKAAGTLANGTLQTSAKRIRIRFINAAFVDAQ